MRNESGATAVEFAIVAPVALLLMLGTIEMGLTMMAQNILEGATFSTSRLGKTGYVDEGISREETMLQVLEDRAGVLLDTKKIKIESKAYKQFGDIGQPEPFIDANGNGIRDEGENYTDVNGNGVYDSDMGASGLGNAQEVVVYTIEYPWRIITPFVGKFFGKDGVILLSARTVVQNEPY